MRCPYLQQSASGQYITVCPSQGNLESNRAYSRICIGQSLGPWPIRTSVLRLNDERGTNQVFFLSRPIGPPFNLLIIAGSSANCSILWSCGKGVYDILMAGLPCERGIVYFLSQTIDLHSYLQIFQCHMMIGPIFQPPPLLSYYSLSLILGCRSDQMLTNDSQNSSFVIDLWLPVWPNANQC